MIVVVGVVAANSRRKRAASHADERVYETPDRAVIANSLYSAPATLPRPRRMTQVVPEYEEPAVLTASALPAQPAEPYYDLGTAGDGYLTIEDVVNA
jgi:hypothetical protein